MHIKNKRIKGVSLAKITFCKLHGNRCKLTRKVPKEFAKLQDIIIEGKYINNYTENKN